MKMKNRSVSIISLKGGVGKTTLSSNLAYILSKHFNHKTMIVDSNLSAPGLAVHFGILEPNATVHDVLEGSKGISEAVHSYGSLDVMPAALSNKQVDLDSLPKVVSALKSEYDVVLLDSAPSFSYEFISCLNSSDTSIIVTTPDYSSITNALQTIKLAEQRDSHILGLVINKRKAGLFKKHQLSNKEIERITGKKVIGTVRHDKNVDKALSKTAPVFKHKPKSWASKDIFKIAEIISKVR